MGCVRDRTPLKIFARNFVELQKNTGAFVMIVVMKENKIMLYNGLTYAGFVRGLQNDVSNRKLQPPVPT